MTTIRPATDSDLDTVASLHAARIAEGFLSSLGPRFLRRLYRRVLRSPGCFVLVATNDAGDIQGFVAAVDDLTELYKRFIVRDGLVAGITAAPRLVGAVPRVVETLRYPSTTTTLPSAEILAVAVAESATGAGIGRTLVHAATAEYLARAVPEAKVVTTADNASALAMYRACGFTTASRVEVHPGRESEVLVWTAF